MCDINDPFVNDIYKIIYEDARHIHNSLCGFYRINTDNHSLDENLNIRRIDNCRILQCNLGSYENLPNERAFDTIRNQFYNICLRYNDYHGDEKMIFSNLFYALISSECEQFPEYDFTPSSSVNFT